MSLTRKLLGAVALRWSLMILGGKKRERCGMRALERVDDPLAFRFLGDVSTGDQVPASVRL